MPISQYVPKLAVKRSTKELTDFQEFNLSSTTAASATKFNKYVSNASKYQTNHSAYNSVMTNQTKILASNPKQLTPKEMLSHHDHDHTGSSFLEKFTHCKQISVRIDKENVFH